MRLISVLLLAFVLAFPAAVSAQEENAARLAQEKGNVLQNPVTSPSGLSSFSDGIEHDTISAESQLLKNDSILNHSHYMLYRPYRLALSTPWLMSGGPMWLHEGLNADIGMGVMVGLGRNNPFHGASFFTNLSMMYAYPLGSRWTLTGGGTFSRFRMFDTPQNLMSIEGAASYRMSGKVTLSGFASHTFGSGSSSLMYVPVPGLVPNSTTIGVDMGVKFSDSFFIQVSLSRTTFGNSGDARPGNAR